MATAVWPASLPQLPLQQGWGWTPQSNKVSFQPSVGASIDRRRATAVVYDYQASFPDFTDAQVATFETFYHTTLESGVLHYLWDDPVSGTSYKWKIRSYEFRGVGPGFHSLSAALRRLPGAAV